MRSEDEKILKRKKKEEFQRRVQYRILLRGQGRHVTRKKKSEQMRAERKF